MKTTSFRETVLDQVGNFLLDINFDVEHGLLKVLKEELVDLANQLSDYYEEGNHLYPEVLLLDDFDYFKVSVPCFYHILYEGAIEKGALLRAIKMAAPLADNGWNIFIELKKNEVRWGVVNSEQSVINVSMYEQVVGDVTEKHPVVYVRNVVFKTVEFISKDSANKYIISLSLRNIDDILKNESLSLCKMICKDCEKEQTEFCGFLEKTINVGLQKGHGNLLVVVKDINPSIPEILKEGVTLLKPLDLYQYFCNFKDNGKELISHSELQKNSELIISMMNHDGIIVFSTKGKVLGYHYIVENNIKTTEKVIGGARSKAFAKLSKAVANGSISAVFMRTQEGSIKFDSNE